MKYIGEVQLQLKWDCLFKWKPFFFSGVPYPTLIHGHIWKIYGIGWLWFYIAVSRAYKNKENKDDKECRGINFL